MTLLPQPSVLVVDDSPDIHMLVEVRLRPEGVVVHHAESGELGLKLARELKPDLILLDVDMPGLSGLDVCRELKRGPCAGIPVIFLTGAADVQAKVEGFDAGAVDYVTKPFEPTELRARVRAALRTKRYLDLLEARAHIDGLTGLRNRAYLDLRIADELAAACRYGREVSLVMIDVDHFKGHNDHHGHPFGDQVLQTLGELLAASVRSADVACRFGGEEFALVLTETDGPSAAILAERIRVKIAGLPFKVRGQAVLVTASLGVASTTDFADRSKIIPATLLSLADGALYNAKRSGRNRVLAAA